MLPAGAGVPLTRLPPARRPPANTAALAVGFGAYTYEYLQVRPGSTGARGVGARVRERAWLEAAAPQPGPCRTSAGLPRAASIPACPCLPACTAGGQGAGPPAAGHPHAPPRHPLARVGGEGGTEGEHGCHPRLPLPLPRPCCWRICPLSPRRHHRHHHPHCSAWRTRTAASSLPASWRVSAAVWVDCAGRWAWGAAALLRGCTARARGCAGGCCAPPPALPGHSLASQLRTACRRCRAAALDTLPCAHITRAPQASGR